MEIWELYVSAIEEPLRYVRTRFSPGIYVPLALLLAAASTVGGGFSRRADFLSAAAVACTMLFQFRLWDDLADRERDRRAHPKRVLVQSNSLAKFRVLLAGAFALNAVVVHVETDGSRIAAYLFLNAALFAWYRWMRSFLTDTLVGSHVLLLKYPAMVYVLSGWFPAGDPIYLALSMAMVYLCFCAYELLHDPETGISARPFRLLAMEMAALVTAPVWVGLLLPQASWALAASQGAVALAAVVAAVHTLRLHRARTHAGLWRYAPFVIVLLQVLTLSVWRES
jgi:hypothetical protein